MAGTRICYQAEYTCMCKNTEKGNTMLWRVPPCHPVYSYFSRFFPLYRHLIVFCMLLKHQLLLFRVCRTPSKVFFHPPPKLDSTMSKKRLTKENLLPRPPLRCQR